MGHASQLSQEIRQQPAVLRRLLMDGLAPVRAAAQLARDFDPQWVVIAARGTSDNAARYAKYLFGIHNRLSVALAMPSLCTIYDAPPRLSRALCIGISQSGQSPDVVSVLHAGREQGAATIAITNDASSPLAQAADVCIPLGAGEEKAVAATKTYTAELMAIAMLSAALSGDEEHMQALAAAPDAVQRSITMCPDLGALGSQFCDAARFVVLARGLNYCTAFEIALKMKETSYVLAEPYSPADFRHGPIALLDEGFPVLVVAPSGAGSEDVAELLPQLAERGARTLVLSDRQDLLQGASFALPLPQGVPEWVSPLVSIVPGQLWAQALSVAKGFDPDQPRGLSKVTLAR